MRRAIGLFLSAPRPKEYQSAKWGALCRSSESKDSGSKEEAQ